MSAHGTQIPALWFDRRGCGPSELALELHPFAAEPEYQIPASLGLRIRVDTDDDHRHPALVYGTAAELVDSGFNLGIEHVAELHRQIAAWLAATDNSQASSASQLDFAALTTERDSLRAHVEAQDARIKGLEATLAKKVTP